MTRQVAVKNIKIGGGAPVTVQSMLNAPSFDVQKNIEQARSLQKAGCDIIRVALPDMESVRLVEAIKNAVDTPLVADIHFDYRIALAAAERGVDKIRINPGNIGDEERVKAVAAECRRRGIPIRVGVNSGSLEREVLMKYSRPTAQALCESALNNIALLEKYDFNDIVVSMKSTDVPTMVEAYRRFSKLSDYPLHIGVTEAGVGESAVVKSAVGIGALLLGGIGDTIRVSLTGEPEAEVAAGRSILRAAGLYHGGVEVISCPTCGRTRIDVAGIAARVAELTADITVPVKAAVMGCVVNGPGEARDADIGIAGGDGFAVLIKGGETLGRIDADIAETLAGEIRKMAGEQG